MIAKEALRAMALAEGLTVAGFAPALPPPHHHHLDGWLAAGHHGGMAWLARHPDQRQDPRTIWQEVATILVVGLSVRPAAAAMENNGQGRIAAYAAQPDYHGILTRRLEGLIQRIGAAIPHRILVDTGPILEKPLAVAAGLGWQGKNTLLISRRHGAWLHLAELFLPWSIPPDPQEPDRCGRCTRCLDHCPTGAITPYRLDATRCLAAWTVEFRGPIPHDLRKAMGLRLFGCDDCLAVCPWNRFVATTTLPVAAQAATGQLATRHLPELAQLDGPGFRRWAGTTPMIRLGVNRLLRNVAIALGNWQDFQAIPPLLALISHLSPLVRSHAAWGLGQHGNHSQCRAALLAARKKEADPTVLAEMELALTQHAREQNQ